MQDPQVHRKTAVVGQNIFFEHLAGNSTLPRRRIVHLGLRTSTRVVLEILVLFFVGPGDGFLVLVAVAACRRRVSCPIISYYFLCGRENSAPRSRRGSRIGGNDSNKLPGAP